MCWGEKKKKDANELPKMWEDSNVKPPGTDYPPALSLSRTATYLVCQKYTLPISANSVGWAPFTSLAHFYVHTTSWRLRLCAPYAPQMIPNSLSIVSTCVLWPLFHDSIFIIVIDKVIKIAIWGFSVISSGGRESYDPTSTSVDILPCCQSRSCCTCKFPQAIRTAAPLSCKQRKATAAKC